MEKTSSSLREKRGQRSGSSSSHHWEHRTYKQEGVSTRRRPCPSQVQNQGVTPSLPSEGGHTVAPASGLRCPNK